MHNSFNPDPISDIGFVVDRFGDLACSQPIGAHMRSGCGFYRDTNGDMTFDGNPITVGFVYIDGDGDMTFRIT